QNEIKDQIKRINDELSGDQRKIIKMNFFESKSHKKIAQELEIPLGTVKSRIRHILTKLQRII
ncbi:sigma-70 family RNA polymerase sigma factor, partial [Pelagibacteraceae bacterium]|nr:sigma-70 family RNA polymerase sigma factor [Pelagibacteraceae bacterium]